MVIINHIPALPSPPRHGSPVKKVNPNGSRTLYVGNVFEVDKNASGGVTGTKNYYPAAGAMRVNSTLYFLRADHLGSATAVTDSSGNVTGRQLYYPYGQMRLVSGAMYTDRLFTGQREMAGLGIYTRYFRISYNKSGGRDGKLYCPSSL